MRQAVWRRAMRRHTMWWRAPVWCTARMWSTVWKHRTIWWTAMHRWTTVGRHMRWRTGVRQRAAAQRQAMWQAMWRLTNMERWRAMWYWLAMWWWTAVCWGAAMQRRARMGAMRRKAAMQWKAAVWGRTTRPAVHRHAAMWWAATWRHATIWEAAVRWRCAMLWRRARPMLLRHSRARCRFAPATPAAGRGRPRWRPVAAWVAMVHGTGMADGSRWAHERVTDVLRADVGTHLRQSGITSRQGLRIRTAMVLHSGRWRHASRASWSLNSEWSMAIHCRDGAPTSARRGRRAAPSTLPCMVVWLRCAGSGGRAVTASRIGISSGAATALGGCSRRCGARCWHRCRAVGSTERGGTPAV